MGEEPDLQADATATEADIAGARISLQDQFPQAAQMTFGKSFVHGDGEARAVCGYVDVQEPDDGFEGDERFIFEGGEITLDEPDGGDVGTQKWRNECEG